MNFTKDELIRSRIAQERGIVNVPPPLVLVALDFTLAGCERIRAALGGNPMVISSGYRSPELNAAVGGSKTSQHMLGQAVDFTCPKFGDPQEVVKRLAPMMRLLGIDQLILERGWVHASFTLAPRYQVLKDAGSGRLEVIA